MSPSKDLVRLRPAPLLLAWKTLKTWNICDGSDANDRLNAMVWVVRTYRLTSDESARLFSEIWDDESIFEAVLQKALDEGKLVKPRVKPAVGSLWFRVADGVQCEVESAKENYVELKFMGGRESSPTAVFFKEYTPVRVSAATPPPVKAVHRKLAKPFSSTSVGQDLMARAIATVDMHPQDLLTHLKGLV